jgi:hypothetical protein
MFQIYLLLFWVPAIASGLLLAATWRTGILARPPRLLVWFLAALVLQVVSGVFSPIWAVALALQSTLAVYLLIKINVG